MDYPFYHYDPMDPLNPIGSTYDYNPPPAKMTSREWKRYQRIKLKMFVNGLITFVVAIVVMAVIVLLTSCSTQKTISSDVTDHRITDMLQRMDSLMHVRVVTKQDSTWRQEIMRQFQSIREKSDTSHTVVVDSVGNIIKERIVINNVRETATETDRQEREYLMHRLDAQDSIINIMSQQIAHTDSLLQQRQQTVVKEVPRQLSWWQQLRLWLGNLVLAALALYVVWRLIKIKKPFM